MTVSTIEPTRDGHTFTGWNTEADGSGTSYSGDDTYTLPDTGTDTLYAQWQPIEEAIAPNPEENITIGVVGLTYDPQGGSGEPGDQTGGAAENVTVSTTEPTRPGYTVMGWNTEADGSGTSYSGDDTYTLPDTGTDTLYAQWQPNPSNVELPSTGNSSTTEVFILLSAIGALLVLTLRRRTT